MDGYQLQIGNFSELVCEGVYWELIHDVGRKPLDFLGLTGQYAGIH